MPLPLLAAGLGQLFAPIGCFFTGLVLHRNTSKVTETQSSLALLQKNTQKDIAQNQQDTQRDIAQAQIKTQFAIANSQLAQAKKLAEEQRLTQLKIAYLNIQNQTQLEQSRQNFQGNLEKERQNFQERMEYLRIGTQMTLEKARQSFELQCQELSQQHQEELTRYVQSVNIAINQQNLDFQKWRMEQEARLQTHLAEYNRETQLILATYHRQTQLMSPIVHKILENWPLSLLPIQILDSHYMDGIIPLRIFISPPDVDYDRFGQSAKNFPKMEKRIAEGLGQFLSPNYPLNSNIRPTELLDGAWESKRFRGGSSIKSLFGMLKSEPTLILESEVEEGYLNFKVAYWGFGQENYCYERIISRLPYLDILYESAKARALKWKTDVRDKLLAKGKSLQEVNQKYGGDNAINLMILEEDEEFRKDGIVIPRHYQINNEDWNILGNVLVNCHCLIAGWITDAHYLINYDVDPLLPELLPTLLTDESGLPVNEVIQAIVSGYKDLFKAIEIEQPHRIPDLALKLAKGLANLSDKSFANEMFDYSLKAKLNLNN